MIYFIQDQSTCHIKIGFTDGAAVERLKALQTGCPSGLVLLGTITGDKAKERQLHTQFAPLRVHGEWFRPHPDLLSFMIGAFVGSVAADLRAPRPPNVEKALVPLEHAFYCTLPLKSVKQNMLLAINALTGRDVGWDEAKYLESHGHIDWGPPDPCDQVCN